MKRKLSDKEKMLAYVLNKEFEYSQKDIADFMGTRIPGGVSQPTIANAIKDAGFLIQINQLQKLYLEVLDELYASGFRKKPSLIGNAENENIIEIPSRDLMQIDENGRIPFQLTDKGEKDKEKRLKRLKKKK